MWDSVARDCSGAVKVRPRRSSYRERERERLYSEFPALSRLRLSMLLSLLLVAQH